MLRRWNRCFVFAFGSGIFWLVSCFPNLSVQKEKESKLIVSTRHNLYANSVGLKMIFFYMYLFDSDCICYGRKIVEWLYSVQNVMLVVIWSYAGSKGRWCFWYLILACQCSNKVIIFLWWHDLFYVLLVTILFIFLGSIFKI